LPLIRGPVQGTWRRPTSGSAGSCSHRKGPGMRKSFRFVLLIALPAMAVAASGLFVLGLATGLGSPGASPIELLWTIGRESFLADKLDQQCAEALERIWEREHIAHEVAEGRLGLAEAATRFAELNLELCPDALALQQAGEPGDP